MRHALVGKIPRWVCGGLAVLQVLVCILAPETEAVLTTDEKQIALDLHNSFRREVAQELDPRGCAYSVRQLQWDETLAAVAQDWADRCFFSPNRQTTVNHPTLGPAVRKGENLYAADLTEGIDSAIRSWFSDDESSEYTQLVWPNTSLVGCGRAECQKLSSLESFSSGSLVVCNYLTPFIAGTPAFPEGGSFLTQECYEDAGMCIEGLCASTEVPPTVPDDGTDPGTPTDRTIYRIQTTTGSLGGGTRITIQGEGFSRNQFAGGNKVMFRDGTVEYPCDVIPYYSRADPDGEDMIVCDTRPSPDGTTNRYDVIVTVDDGNGIEEEANCGGSCSFWYQNGRTPRLTRLAPLAISAAADTTDTIQLYGRLYTSEFQENLDDPSMEYFQRILLGGRACDTMDEDGELYGVHVPNNWGWVRCLPNVTNIIDSMNATVILALRGNSFIEYSDALLAIDNKFRPYHFQTYAEITGVTPRSGSREGGTRITVTVDVTLTNYTDTDVKVLVGGVACQNVTLVPPNMVECITGPQPPSSTYYPGGRGLLRELWKDSTNLDAIESFGRSELSSRQERAYRTQNDPLIREFGETDNFTQRWSGFFIPPESCLYTFNMRSDDPGRLFLSPNMSAESKVLIAYADQYTGNSWNRFDTQLSEPIWLDKGKPYYIEAHGVNFPGNWELGFGAKIHCYDYTTYPYNGDTEEQLIVISSTVVLEEHTVHITALPAIQTVQITYNENLTSVDQATVCLNVGDEAISFDVGASSEDIASSVNELPSVQSIGYIEVFQDEYERDDNFVHLTFVFVSISESSLPLLSVNSDPPNCNQSLFTVTVETVQNLTVPQSINLGFDDSVVPRYTNYLPVEELTSDAIHEEVTSLFGSVCDETSVLPSKRIRFAASYEDSDEESRDDSTSFCGLFSLRSPGTLWEDSGEELIAITTYRQLCFAYYTTSTASPTVYMDLEYYDSTTRVQKKSTIGCQSEGTAAFQSWDYSCIDLFSCFNSFGGGLNPLATRIYFTANSGFWIDEVTLATSTRHITQTAPPARPGGVTIKYIEVGGGILDAPLLWHPLTSDSQSSEIHPYGSVNEYTLGIAEFSITYVVDDCQHGISLIQGSHMDKDRAGGTRDIWVERTAAGTPPVTGTFDVSFNGRTIYGIDAEVSSSTLDNLLEANFYEEGGFTVSRLGSCSGYQWEVGWATKVGDIPQMTVSGEGLNGSNPEATVRTKTDGGLWIRPFRADMLRLPETTPQVEVIINDIPSSCDDCSFTFTEASTPQVLNLTPFSGQGGTMVTLYGSGLTDDISSISVTIGGSTCDVTQANSTQITCTAADHAAGIYAVRVFIEDIGFASVHRNLSFNYLLTVSSITPNVGSLGGGEKITITGNGFFDFSLVDTEEIEDLPFLGLPWFATGFALPTIRNFDKLGSSVRDLYSQVLWYLQPHQWYYDATTRASCDDHNDTSSFPCPDFNYDFKGPFDVFQLYTIVSALYVNSGTFVQVGDVPCVIISGSLNTIECITLPHHPAEVSVTVNMLTERAVVDERFLYSPNHTALVSTVTPASGPAFGGTQLQIQGNGFDSSVKVHIGSRECEVTEMTDTSITCTTEANAPGVQSIFVKTAGIAISQDALIAYPDGSGAGGDRDSSNATDVPPIFPLFTFQFSISSIQPYEGSVLGGTRITIYGAGLSDGASVQPQVYVGEKYCEVIRADATEIECLTPSSSLTHTVYLEDNGFDPVSGYDFSWSARELNISVGDTVTWEWALTRPGFQANVFQTPSSFQSSFVPGGFFSETGATGTLTYTFNQIGTYYYVSDTSSIPVVRGSIHVGELSSTLAVVRVFDSTNGFEAEYVPDDIGSGSGIELKPITDGTYMPSHVSATCDHEQKLAELPEAGASSQYLATFTYSVCETPVVYSVDPRVGTLGTRFTIEGVGFSPDIFSNTVLFSGSACSVMASNGTMLTCQFGSDSSPSPFIGLSLALHVAGLGNALVQSPVSTSISVNPAITEISPPLGSLEGGTDVLFKGWGFSVSGFEATVSIGGVPCELTQQTYESIRCTTSSNSEGDYPVIITFYASDGTGSLKRNTVELQAECTIEGECSFNYSVEVTPMVTAISTVELEGPQTTILTLNGSGFSMNSSENEVFVGEYRCVSVESSAVQIQCAIDPIPAGSYALSVKVCQQVDSEEFTGSQCLGLAQINLQNKELESVASVNSVSPASGSTQGGTMITVAGVGFGSDASLISATINGNPCTVRSANYSHFVCKTPSNPSGTFLVEVSSHGMTFPSIAMFTYSAETTPTVTEIFPLSGQANEMVVISGMNLGQNLAGTQVSIGGSVCQISDVNENNNTALHCMAGSNLAGEYPLSINIEGVGNADTAGIIFTYTLVLTDFDPKMGSLAGRNPITLTGLGLNPNFITVTICEQVCELTVSTPTLTSIECEVPPAQGQGACNVTVESQNELQTFDTPYQYLASLTPIVHEINDTRGGTQGGTAIQLTGEGFAGSVWVTIADVECEIKTQTDSTIDCVTGASGRTIRAQVMVGVNGDHIAMSDNIYFWYVDLWSSPFTWGGGPLPLEGDFVVIPRGQTLILDTTTPILSYLLIQGGELIFDDEQEDNVVQLHTQGALITEGGRLQIGTEAEPFLHKTTVVLYGHVLSNEVPVYGAKTLALREGEIDMHGRPINVTWTRLAVTANPGDTTIQLQDAVDWEIGGKVVIASTSLSQRENEELEIIGIDSNGLMLTVSPPLEYEHISVRQTIEGRFIDTSAEVGLLTRNIVVRGNVNEEWLEDVEGCDEEFRPGQFEIQTCFLGRFGAETLSDQFGSQIMIHAAEQNKGDVVGRFEYIEVTHAGQAFRLGRYPIHFHLNGDVSTSYVRGCAIHHTFNRAVTIHAVDRLLVEKNVAYNILGHAYFLEDGIEQYNIIQDNLGVFVRASSSLLNVDITPATYWIVNPNNIVRRNAAAGGTHFGYWYRLPNHPTGPSATTSVCPQHLPLGEFINNTAHSFGWYGLWVNPGYFPRVGGGCSDDLDHAPVVFEKFQAWRNDRGIEFTEAGSLQVKDSILLDNTLAGFEVVHLEAVWGEDGPLIQDTLIVGHSDLEISPESCTEAGIKTPKSFYLTVSRVTFVNFDRPGCAALRACSQCKDLQGGFESRYQKISFVNSPAIAQWQWSHEHVHRFLDDSLPETTGPSSLIPTSGILPTDQCQAHSRSSLGVSGSVCSGSVEFVRFALYSTTPSSIEQSDIHISSPYGNTVLEYRAKRLLTSTGHMGILERNQSYHLDWPDGRQFTNVTYDELITGLNDEDYILFSQTFPRSLDFVTVNNQGIQQNDTLLEDPGQAETGDWYINENNTLFYVVRGAEDPTDQIDVRFSTTTCAYEGCIFPTPPTLPPPGRPDVIVMWSNASIWPNMELPKAGEDVYIDCSFHVLVDVEIPRLGTLTICGGLELDDSMDHVVEADLIFLEGGLLIAGYPDTLFTHKANFVLHGNLSSDEYYLPNQGPVLGAKALGVFGELILHAETKNILWTRLAVTAGAESNTITVVDDIDWEAGDEIVITSTSYEALETETFTILEVSGNDIVLVGTLQYSHTAEDDYPLISAEVGLLTRNIVIENGDSELAEEEAFGCRVLVGSYWDQIWYVGSAKIRGVEFRGCGQFGYTDIDPRFALAILSVGSYGNESYVRQSSIHNGYNTAIGVFGTNGVIIDTNVIHDTVGPSITVTDKNHEVTNNLASLSRFPGTYRRIQPLNPDWTANFEVHNAEGLILTGNVAAGGAKAGFHTRGVACTPDDNSRELIANNIAHSTLHGVHTGYSDGHSSGCSMFPSFTVYSCYHYGIFAYSGASVVVSDALLANNYAGIFVAVIGPPALSHVLGDKTVTVESSTIVSATSQYECDFDRNTNAPIISQHENSHRGLRTASNGHAGIIIPSFISGSGGFPSHAWFDILSYPAISGHTTITDVTFVNFNQRCDSRKDRALTTSTNSEDCYHPVFLQGITFTDSDSNLKIFNHDPNLSSVNPADCVDMDCDGLKKLLLRDLDGSFTGTGMMMSLTSRAEFEWEGDTRRGIGDYRIPRTMLSYPNGSRIDADVAYPNKGIVRSTSVDPEATCEFIEAWNMYQCSGLDHLMLILESLDIDTEVRRLSPIGIAADQYIDLLNGPQDHGWCGGYTCQERISTFYAIVSSGLVYTIGLTSTNPQDMALHLLHSDSSEAIVVRIIYTNPQRLDVYYDGSYVVPKNAIQQSDGNLEYMIRDASNPNAFDPLISDIPGTNYYDRDTKQLHITIKGTRPIEIRTQPVIQVALDLSVSVEDFFDPDRLILNLAFVLGIPENRIRVVDVIRESSRRKRAEEQNEMVSVVIEVGDPPGNATMDPDTQMNQTNSTTGTMQPVIALDVNTLNELQSTVIQAIQTAEILDNINATIESAMVQSAEPPPADPGMRATNETGGLQPDEVSENDTIATFYEQQLVEEQLEENETQVFFISVPSYLAILTQPSVVVKEGEVFSYPPAVGMFDDRDEIVESLGLGDPWVLTATIKDGPEGAYLTNAAVRMIGGQANFDNLTVSHPGTYSLCFNVTYPLNADPTFFAISNEFTVVERIVSIQIEQQPQSGNTTFPLYPHPQVYVIEDNSVLEDHGWRNRTWYMLATAQDYSTGETTDFQWRVELEEGKAVFTDIVFPESGRYQLVFNVSTEPPTQIQTEGEPDSYTSSVFEIVNLPFTRFIVVYADSCTDVLTEGEQNFVEAFARNVMTNHEGIEVYNATIQCGSVIVSFFATAMDPYTLQAFVDAITSSNDTLTFVYNSLLLAPLSVTQDPNYLIEFPTEASEDELVLILASTIPSGIILLAAILLVLIFCIYQRHRNRNKVFEICVRPVAVNPIAEGRYIEHRGKQFPDTKSVDSFYLVPDHKTNDLEAQSVDEMEMSELPSSYEKEGSEVEIVVSTGVEVLATASSDSGAEVIVNERALRSDASLGSLDELQDSLEEIITRSMSNSNNNNRDNSSYEPPVALNVPDTVAASEGIMETQNPAESTT